MYQTNTKNKKMQSHKGEWLTNHPRTYRGWFPRRDAKMVDGPPKATDKYTVDELLAMKQVGVYLDEDIEDGIKSRKLIRS